MFALSEVSWGSSEPKNYKEFENRVVEHFKILDKMNINYAKSIYNIGGKVIPVKMELLTNFQLHKMQTELNIQ
ncbi:hypothetical protein [Chryseobacterium indoltheticum]|uniref:hypothetical protein n=1 Tax=Chryseobacterium indoltheticum TaxID=254 RepID=UPI003F4931AA